ncbi:hypothetical protein [Microbacterium sp. YY-01]|uniref:hypothetical protein n=1 Tax=Microbacterium sp. YY-01 TaxID=3421634 RepID=UPI003D1693C0
MLRQTLRDAAKGPDNVGAFVVGAFVVGAGACFGSTRFPATGRNTPLRVLL